MISNSLSDEHFQKQRSQHPQHSTVVLGLKTTFRTLESGLNSTDHGARGRTTFRDIGCSGTGGARVLLLLLSVSGAPPAGDEACRVVVC